MFSSTTIASSITMPTASASASSVIMLSVKCASIIRPNVEMIDTGIEIAAITVERKLRRRPDLDRVIAHDVDRVPGRQALLQLFDRGLHVIDDGDRVRAGLLA